MPEENKEANEALLEKLKSVKTTVRRNFQDMVNLLTSVIALSSPYLGGHLRRVAEQGKALADILEFPKEESYAVYYAGLLHDIGIIGATEEMLTRKEGPQTEEERELFRNHPVMGEDIIKTVYDLRRIGVIIRGHHENYNGEGFPDALKGKDIPAGSRIIRIVNDYDRLVYVQGLSAGKALDTLFQEGGQLYDPEYLERFGSYIRSQGFIEKQDIREIDVSDLEEGDFLLDDLYMKNGMLLMPKGVALNQAKLKKIRSFSSLLEKHQKIHISG